LQNEDWTLVEKPEVRCWHIAYSLSNTGQALAES